MKSNEGEFMPAVAAGYCGLLNGVYWRFFDIVGFEEW